MRLGLACETSATDGANAHAGVGKPRVHACTVNFDCVRKFRNP